ncbi:uncharacterized protein LOC108678282 [Hyalella azteca]|uniref:Uncharacterized protein LOC108678282 n=1 Tax=Hyalella azteca TaxID=294128 RepID=A0A8B7P7W8_HYAAZ|nr:uncharacterized protein LOC108678282 [Hyalella azteca]
MMSTIQAYSLFSLPCIKKCIQITTETQVFQEILQKIHQLAIENHFQMEGKVKDLNELLAEFKDKNMSEPALEKLKEGNSLNIQQCIFQEQSEKFNWNEKQIYLWAKGIKSGKIKEFSDHEAIAVILRANFLITGYELTNTQILCSLVALKNSESMKGKLLEVATGEGKSTIISILAIINALRGNSVDILTSSPVLAERDAKQQAKLYRLFGLSCSDNNDKIIYLKGGKDCYLSDIVYGEMSQFQFDILRDNYSKLGTLCGRKFSVAIVDEVDSMLIDDSSKIARLSSTVPGMDHFHALYVFIWQRLVSIRNKFIMCNGKLYFVYGTVNFENGNITSEYADEKGNVMKITDLEALFAQLGDLSPIGEVVEDVDEFLRKLLIRYLDDQMQQNRIYIPSNFADFVQKQKSKWITNAVEALNYQENVHYVVQNGEIKPVDYHSTGIVQSSTNWSDGLHQFLQLKHNLKMTSETLTTNFLSNVGLMKKYEHVCGLTGTLGSDTARGVLRSVYKVDLFNIPQKRKKQFLQLDSIVAMNEDSWLEEIMSNIVLETQKDRGILVVCETIENASQISDMLNKKLPPTSVKLYTMNDTNQEKNVERILPGQVIIATNLAGRGTDIKTDEIEATGGLHVILTFMPPNQRVEDQAFGRTARQGKRGTGVMILNARNMDGYSTTTTAVSTGTMKAQRDEIEKQQLQIFRDQELELIQVKDKLFDTFCSFLNDEIRVKIRKKTQTKIKKLLNWFTDIEPTVYECCVLSAVEEQWAGFLGKLDDRVIKCEEAAEKCSALIDQLRNDFKNEQLIKNPYYFITIANDMLVNTWGSTTSNTKDALGYFQKAVELEQKWQQKKHDEKPKKSDGKDSDSEGSKSDPATDKNEDIYTPGAAHVGIAWCMLRLKEEGYKDKALASFKVALKCLAGEMSTLNAAQLLLNNLEHKQSEFENSPLCKQLNTKTTILGSYLNGINASINALKRSKRMLDLVAVKRHEVTSGEPCILETLTYYTELERNDEDKHKFTNENLKLNDEEIYSLTFNHLTCRQDSGTIDQAWITIDNAFDEKLLAKETQTLSKLKALSTAVKSKFSSDEYSSLAQGSCNIKINLNQVDLSTVSSVLFNPDQEFKDLTYETTLMKLKEKQSCLHYCRLTNSPKADLLIHSNDDINLKEQFNDKQINELLEIVKQKRNNPSLRFDIVFRKANENPLNSLFKSDNKSCSSSVVLHVEFQDLSQEAAQAKLQSVQARSVHVGVVLNKLDLKKLIELNKSLSSGKLLLNQSQVHEKLNMQQLLVQVEKLKTDHSFCYARFEDLTLDQAKSIVKNCNENAKFVLSFCDISDFYASELNEGQVNFSFDGLSQDSAKIVVRVLRNAHLEFSLEFKNLSDKEVRFILQHANLEQEAVEISKVKNVCDLFMKSSSPTFELNQFVCRGLEHIIEINEKLFVPWWSVTAVAALGVGQVLIGGVLMATGFGSSLGMGLVTEGVADVFIAFRAFKTRQFQWSDYCKQKAVSLAISAATMGYSKWKEGVQNAAKGVETLATGMAQEMAEQVGTQIISNSKVLGQVVLSTGKNMKSLAFKVVCTKAAEAVAREGMNTAIQNLSNFSFGLLKPKISESVQERVRMAFCHTELMRLLRKFYAIDLASGSHQLQSKVESIVAETVNPQRDFMQRQFDSICLPLIKGVLSDANRFGSHASLVIRMISTLNGLHQVTTLADTVVKAILQKLGSYDKNSMTMSLILHKSQKVPKLTAIVLAKKFKELEIFDENDGIGILDSDASESCGEVRAKIDALQSAWKTTPKQMLDELSGHLTDSSSLEADVTKSIVFIDHFYHKFVSIDLDSFNTIIKSVSDQISQQLVKVMDSQLLQPWSTLAVSGLTDAISKRLQHHIFVDERENSDSQKADESKYQELLKKQSLTAEEKAFMGKYGQFRTFAQQLDYNAKDFCTAYSQCEIYYHASRDGASSTPPDPNVQQMANSVRGGEPANLAVMAALAKNNGIKLKVVDDPNYVRSQEDIENGVEVMYVKEDPGSGVGHAFYMDSDGQIKDVKSEGYDCAFAAFSKILEGKGIEKSVSDLRAEIANSMESNSASFTKALAAETWIRKNNPEAAKNLFVAGLYKDSTTGRLKLEDGDVEKMITAMKNPKIKSDSKAGGYFKRMVRKRPGDETKEDRGDETEETLHHILPRAEITEAVIESQARNPTQFRKDFEEYINLPKIKRVFEEHLLVNTNVNADVDVPLKTPQFTGTILYNSVSWYSNNLVYGPAPEKRKNDPKNSLDTEILEVQTDAYQNASLTAWDAIKPDNDKRDFGQYLEAVKDLTPPDARWKKDQDGKYVAMPANTTANTTANTM